MRRRKNCSGVRFTIVRFTRLADALRKGERFNARTIAAEFEVSSKTIQRDLIYLRDRMGYEFHFNPRTGQWKLLKAPIPVL